MADHPAVKDVAVIPLKHPVHQDVPVCAIQPHRGCTVSEQDLLEHGRALLGARSPKIIVIVEAIPRNDLGKLIRREMRNILTAKLKL